MREIRFRLKWRLLSITRDVIPGIIFDIMRRSGFAIATLVVITGCTVAHHDNSSLEHAGASSAYGDYLSGLVAAENGDTGAATEFLERAYAQDPENSELLQRAFLAEISEGKFTRADHLAEMILAADVKSTSANLVLTVSQVRANKLDAAQKQLANLPQAGINNLLLPVIGGWIAAGQHNEADALERLKPLGDVSVFAPLYELHAGLIAEYSGDIAAAGEHYNSLLAGDPGPPFRTTALIGNFYERQGDATKARDIYTHFQENNNELHLFDAELARITRGEKPAAMVISVGDGVAESLFDLASILNHERDGDQAALFNIRLALWLKPDFPVAEMLLASFFEQTHRYAAALAIYNTIDKNSSFWWNAELHVAMMKKELGDKAGALDELRRMSQDAPSRIDALVLEGDYYRDAEQYPNAVTAYSDAISRVGTVQSQHWSLFFDRGVALERSNDLPRAVADFKKALELEPNQPYVLNYLGYTWIEHDQNLTEARAMIERAVSLRPTDGDIVDSLGWAYFRGGDLKHAVSTLERAAELKPQDPTINDHLGDAYWQVGRHAEAQVQWKRALSLNADNSLKAVIEGKLANGLGKPAKLGQRL